jgi:hypothetical protein
MDSWGWFACDQLDVLAASIEANALKYAPLALEPFVERIGGTLDLDGAAGYQIGYRTSPGGTAITSMTVSAEIIVKALNLDGAVELTVTPDGQVAAVVSHSSSAESILRGALPIDSLVQKAMDFENLRVEEATVSDLKILLQRLEHSVRLVKDAIDQMAGASKTSL